MNTYRCTGRSAATQDPPCPGFAQHMTKDDAFEHFERTGHDSEPTKEHTQDADCTIDPDTDSCEHCGVDHSGDCPDCQGKGFHADSCPQMLNPDHEPAEQVTR